MDVGGACQSSIVDFLDATDYDFLLPRRFKRFLAVGLMVGIAFVPPVQRWWLDQIDAHAEHIAHELVARLASDDASFSQESAAPARGRSSVTRAIFSDAQD